MNIFAEIALGIFLGLESICEDIKYFIIDSKI